MNSKNEAMLFDAVIKHEEKFDNCVMEAVEDSFAKIGKPLNKLDWSNNIDKEAELQTA